MGSLLHAARERLLRLALVLGAVTAVAMAIGAWQRDAIQRRLYYWTGEEVLAEQVKGMASLVLLRLTHPRPDTAPLTPLQHSGLCPYGVNTFLEQEVELEKVDRSLQLISEAGFCWIRQQFPWEDIEIAGKGDYWDPQWNVSTWEKYDRIVALAEEHGLEIIARLDNPPAWSREMGNAPGWTLAPPDDPDDFGDFVYAVVSRYRGRIRYYQIWNEPNIFPEWGDQPADPEGYVELLQVAYRRAKQADPDCVVLAAGLAPTTEEAPPEFGPRNMSDLLYLERMYAAGVQGYFDVMGAMVYGLWTGPYDRRAARDRANYSRAELLREIMVRHGDAHIPIWATELGWNATPEDFHAFPSYGRVTEDQQARYAVQAYLRAAQEWPWMGVMNYWFFRRPSDLERDQTWYYFRMVEPDFSLLPVYHALAHLANQEPAMHVGYHQEDHWALAYAGPWEQVDEPAAVLGRWVVGSTGAQVSWLFCGSELALVLADPAQAERLRLTVNGEPVTLEAGVPWLPGEPRALGVTARLADGCHRAELEVLDGPVMLDGIVVWHLRPSPVPWIAGGLVLAVGVLVIGRSLRRRG